MPLTSAEAIALNGISISLSYVILGCAQVILASAILSVMLSPILLPITASFVMSAVISLCLVATALSLRAGYKCINNSEYSKFDYNNNQTSGQLSDQNSSSNTWPWMWSNPSTQKQHPVFYKERCCEFPYVLTEDDLDFEQDVQLMNTYNEEINRSNSRLQRAYHYVVVVKWKEGSYRILLKKFKTNVVFEQFKHDM